MLGPSVLDCPHPLVGERPGEIDTLDLRPAGGGQRRDLDVEDVLHWGNPPVLRDPTGGRSLEGCDITINLKAVAPHHQMPTASVVISGTGLSVSDASHAGEKCSRDKSPVGKPAASLGYASPTFDKDRFTAMKAGSVLINVARGEIIDEEALVDALRRDHIRGAALDVYVGEFEHTPMVRLWSDPRVLITPHISGASDRDRHGAINVFCANLRAYLDGRPLRNVVDWERGY
jgi:hypothetical protein